MMSPLIRALTGHPGRHRRSWDWVGFVLATIVLTSVTTVLSR